MRRPGSGTASRMSLGWLNLTLSSGGCFRPGTGSTVSVPLVLLLVQLPFIFVGASFIHTLYEYFSEFCSIFVICALA